MGARIARNDFGAQFCDPFRVALALSANRGSSLPLRPPANFWQPCGLAGAERSKCQEPRFFRSIFCATPSNHIEMSCQVNLGLACMASGEKRWRATAVQDAGAWHDDAGLREASCTTPAP